MIFTLLRILKADNTYVDQVKPHLILRYWLGNKTMDHKQKQFHIWKKKRKETAEFVIQLNPRSIVYAGDDTNIEP